MATEHRLSRGRSSRWFGSGIRSLAAPVGLLVALLLPVSGTAQLPGAAPAARAMGFSSMAATRGAAAIGVNPAGLGLPSGPRWSLVFPSATVLSGLDPVTGGDLRSRGGEDLPDDVRSAWLDRIRGTGVQRGQASGDLTALAFTTGPVGIQVSTVGAGRARLTGDAAELLLYGNSGRTGEAGDFELAGSSMDGAVYTTGSVSLAVPLDLQLGGWDAQGFALGATLKYTEGNVLLVGRDGGSVLTGTPVEVDLRFPVIQHDESLSPGRNGGGLGLDLGAAWEGGPWMAAVMLENVFHTFSWDEEDLVFRPGEALFNASSSTSDFEPRPLSSAPQGLRDLVEDLRFAPRLGLGAAYRSGPATVLTGEFRRRIGDGIGLAPLQHIAVGVEHRPIPVLPLRAGAALITDGWRVSAGGGFRMGAVELQAAGLLQRGDAGPATLLSFGVVAVGR